ncbi:bifunctional NAD(P)H-hydrate repair enzyme [Marivirga lumbricoides]|uniref:Bifunctional NAD(P)H-hydrate repair enzyme n=1 Tax=Marivirga lumbricoides TaxID=1046115 RepID=A0ABQ1M1L2_9BACT|nr:bifunctional NAD(P)H-hydrate repair enzyme [Marivirga lumbricoides]
MIKILSTEQVRKADEYTIKNEPISSINLMERASKKVAEWVLHRFSKKFKVCIIAGSGNNGGDGLAVARILNGYGYKVYVLLVLGGAGSDDFNENLDRLKNLSSVNFVSKAEDFEGISGEKIYIDAVFGSGLSRDIEGEPAELIHTINQHYGVKLAIDIPSGIYADKHSTGKSIFKADHTLSFQTPKLAFMMPENYPFVGEWHILDIGLSQEFLRQVDTDKSYFEARDYREKAVTPFGHKGTRGRATVIAGGFGKMGAALLVLKGALHSGIGLLTAQVCPPSVNVVQTAVPEALILQDENDYVLGTLHDYSNQDVLVMGPAIGNANKTCILLREVLSSYNGQLVLDADAINILAENREMLEMLPKNTILTPHPGEFSRLVGKAENDFERIELLQSFCKKYQVITVLKGKYTAVCSAKGEISFNSTGNSGMAKGGSGDLLCGIIAGIYPRKKNTFETVKLAVFLHGLAGDLAKSYLGENFMTPSNIADYLSFAEMNLDE